MINFTPEMREAVNNAMTDGVPVVVAYVDAEDQPQLSFRGSTQVYSDDQLAIWVRNPGGGLLSGIVARPKVAMLYRNPKTRLAWLFHGMARRDDHPAVRKTVYDNTAEPERNLDPDRNGVAVIIDIDRVIQRGQVVMER